VAFEGSVVVLGDVNPGARVLAGGSVIIWGRLRGVVEAGLAEAQARVCALELAPTQLRIGSAVARAPDDPRTDLAPEVAREAGGAIVVEPWS
jgi:septum site-determining protein MinC